MYYQVSNANQRADRVVVTGKMLFLRVRKETKLLFFSILNVLSHEVRQENTASENKTKFI